MATTQPGRQSAWQLWVSGREGEDLCLGGCVTLVRGSSEVGSMRCRPAVVVMVHGGVHHVRQGSMRVVLQERGGGSAVAAKAPQHA